MRLRESLLLLGVLAFCNGVHALELRGELAQGGMVLAKLGEGERAFLNGEALKKTDEGTVVFGFGRDAPDSATLKICRDGDCRSETLSIRQREYNIQRIEGVPQETVTPAPEALERIRREAQLVRSARSVVSERQAFSQAFIWPLKGPVTGVFGSQRVYNGEPRRPHYGVDVAAPTGTVVVAPADATVTLAHPDMYFSGGTLVMDHGYGVSSTFIHLSKVLVEDGQEVKQGQPVAEVGATGRATGPHLDWRMNWIGVRLDPVLVVGPMPNTKSGYGTRTGPESKHHARAESDD